MGEINECMPKIATLCKINVVFMFLIMFTYIYIYIYIYLDFNDEIAILDQYGNVVGLVAFEWFKVSDLKSVSAMLLPSFFTDGPPCD